MGKTTFKLQHLANIWPIVEKWAVGNNYKLEAPGETTRLYTRKSTNANTRISVAIAQMGASVEMRAWYSDAIRAELEIDSPSLYAALPRKEARSEIQELLTALGFLPPNKKKSKNKQSLAFDLGRSLRRLSGKK
jgi:hypothetical protein